MQNYKKTSTSACREENCTVFRIILPNLTLTIFAALNYKNMMMTEQDNFKRYDSPEQYAEATMSTIDYMNECTVRDLVLMLMEEHGMSLHEALDMVYNSETYAKLTDPATGLYFQSPVYIYCYLDRELITGKM